MAGRRSDNGLKGNIVAIGDNLVLKNTGNKDRSRLQANDWVMGLKLNGNLYPWAKYKGGSETNINSYETTDMYSAADYPDL